MVKKFKQLFEGKEESYYIDLSYLFDKNVDYPLSIIQDFIGQDDGGVAGLYFSEYDDINEEWPLFNHKKKLEVILEYLDFEDVYCHDEDDEDDEVDCEKIVWLGDIINDILNKTQETTVSDSMKKEILTIKRKLKAKQFKI